MGVSIRWGDYPVDFPAQAAVAMAILGVILVASAFWFCSWCSSACYQNSSCLSCIVCPAGVCRFPTCQGRGNTVGMFPCGMLPGPYWSSPALGQDQSAAISVMLFCLTLDDFCLSRFLVGLAPCGFFLPTSDGSPCCPGALWIRRFESPPPLPGWFRGATAGIPDRCGWLGSPFSTNLSTTQSWWKRLWHWPSGVDLDDGGLPVTLGAGISAGTATPEALGVHPIWLLISGGKYCSLVGC